MSHYVVQGALDRYVQRASEILAAPGRPVLLDWQMSGFLESEIRFHSRRGLSGQHAVREFNSGPEGHDTLDGLECFHLEHDGRTIQLVHVCDALSADFDNPGHELWVVPAEDYVRLYRYLRTRARRQTIPNQQPPVMPINEKKRLVDNTIGFLRQGREVLEKYGVQQKRGVLLIGPPGNGKTMASRWLYTECRRLGLAWRYVSTEAYDGARSNGQTSLLFSLRQPGIILFDDFDLGMHDRNDTGPTRDHSTLLSELDGVNQHEGVVYLFTTNAYHSYLDPAFLRRGRIDQVIHFANPDPGMRRRLIVEFWHDDILAAVDVERVVENSEGLSFADLTEMKKLLVLRYFDTDEWDWDWAMKTFQLSERSNKSSHIGFGRRRPRSKTPLLSLDTDDGIGV